MQHFYKIIIFLLLSNQLLAGSLKGKVVDSRTNEPLVGASVTVKINDKKIGTLTDLEGKYEIKNISAGTYEIHCSYTGYKKAEHKITVTQDKITFNISLTETSIDIGEVVVKGSVNKETESSARKSEKNSDNILNIIPAKTIQLLPDITVGNILQRISGVSVVRNSSGDGQYAIIRGMDKRYNYTLVNGIKIPSPDNKNRYVPMDIFPAEMLERLEVVKALTPNMEGDAIGGAMNMIMKSAPDHLTISATASTGYSQLFADRPFSGFDSKGIAFQAPSEIHGSKYVAVPSDFSVKHLNYQEVKLPVNSLFGFTLGNRILNNKLGFVIAGSFQKTYRGSNSIFFNPNGQPSPDPAPNTPLFDKIQKREYSTLQTRSGLHTKLDYLLNANNKLSLYGMFMQLDEEMHRHTMDNSFTVLGDESILDRSRFQRQNIYNVTLQGNHTLTPKLKFNWSAAYSNATSKTPDWTDLSVTYKITMGADGKPTESARYIDPVTHIWTHNQDEDKSGYLNFIYDLKKNVEISAGGMYRTKNRSNFYTSNRLNTVLPGADRQVFTTINQAIFSFRPESDAYADTTNGNNYTAQEQITAAYIQGKVLLNKLQIVGGLRAENTSQSYTSQLPVTAIGKTGKIEYLDLLPSVHFKYSLDERQNIRLSYFKGISRPGYFEFIPAPIAGDYFDESGNYNIKHTQSDNIDLRYEIFPKGNEQLLVGAFYKNLTNPIEYGFQQVGNNSYLYTPQNFGNATNYGFELVFVKYLRNWGISGNYTYTKSSITTTKRVYYRDANGFIQNAPPATPEYPTPPTQTRPLQGQSDHIANISLIYKNAKLDFDAQLSWVYTGKRINIVSPYKDLDYWQRGTSQLDFSAEKRLLKNFSVFVKMTNLLNNPIIVEILHPNTLGGLPEQTQDDKILVQKDVFQQTYLAGIRYKLQ